MTECDRPTLSNVFSHEHLLRLYVQAPHAFWRHDVDVSMDAAARLARFAHLAGVKATFYIMATGEFYNPFSPASERAIGGILAAGHRLGLHCDYRPVASQGLKGVESAVNHQWRLLDTAYPGEFGPPYLTSFHMPPSDVLWKDFDLFENAYAAEWKGRYVSDARREWDVGKELMVTDDAQVALHAEHWFL